MLGIFFSPSKVGFAKRVCHKIFQVLQIIEWPFVTHFKERPVFVLQWQWKNSSIVFSALNTGPDKSLCYCKMHFMVFVKTAAWRVKWNFKIRKINVRKRKSLTEMAASFTWTSFSLSWIHRLPIVCTWTRHSGYHSPGVFSQVFNNISSVSSEVKNTLSFP